MIHMDAETKNCFKRQLLDNLTDCILPYWIDKMVDPAGGFYGERDGYDHLVDGAPKGAILNARLLWTFSAAYGATARAEYLDMARRAKDYIVDNFIDRQYGGVFWSLDANGIPLDTKKQFYAIAFTIYALAEYYRVTNDGSALDEAIALFDVIESRSRDRANGGYFEASTRDWKPISDMRLSDKDVNSCKTMNTHLHIIEGYTALLRVWNDERLREAVRSLLRVFFEHIKDAATHHLGLFFDNEWCRVDNAISYGHDIEASWLLLETAQLLGEPDLLDAALRHTRLIADAALEGRCFDGSMIYERHQSGAYDNEKHWWVQAENVVGQLYLAAYHGREDAVDLAWQSWQYILRNLVDYGAGEWYWSRLPDGSVNRADDKAGFWKCPYHNSRMCIEALRLLGD